MHIIKLQASKFRQNLSQSGFAYLSTSLLLPLYVSKSTVISLPVRPHVRQFLVQEFGPDNPEAHRAHQNTYLGKQILLVAEKLPYRLQRVTAPPPLRTSYRIQLPKVLKHFSITDEGRQRLGEGLEKYFQDALVMFVKGQVAVTGNELAALKTFFRLYDINPDDYDLEAGRKQYRDYKDKILRFNGQFLELYGPVALAG